MGENLLDRPTANEALKASLSAIKLVGGGIEQVDAEVARNVLHGDLGYFSGGYPTVYELDDDTRDRLIAHARQDAAHAVILSSRVSRDLRSLKRMLFMAICILIFVAWRLL